ncbi:hypothetical protein [Sorangium sp. So ce1099]|uniref:hypothetical protein n=1 Tax=Sorangium sp. So ce1099 TaxID=3133331 RepID=UPI003F637890
MVIALRRVMVGDARQRLAEPGGDEHVEVILPGRPGIAGERGIGEVLDRGELGGLERGVARPFMHQGRR